MRTGTEQILPWGYSSGRAVYYMGATGALPYPAAELFEQNRVALGKTFPGAKTSLQMHWAQGHAEPEVFVYPAQRGGSRGALLCRRAQGYLWVADPSTEDKFLGFKAGLPVPLPLANRDFFDATKGSCSF